MHVLMISLDTGLLGGDPHGNTIQRHLAYAGRIGHLSIVAYNPARQPQTVRQHAGQLTVYPTNAPTPYLYPWLAYRAAARVHRQRPADVVTTQGPFATGLVGALLKWRHGIPLNVQSHSAFLDNPAWVAERPLRHRAQLLLARVVLRAADTHRVLTEREKALTVARGVPPERVAVLHTPTDVARFAADVPLDRLSALRASLGIAPDAPVILWVGLPLAVKNVELLLDAYRVVKRTHPAARLVLAGDFAGRPDFAAAARAEGAILPGRVAHADLPTYYQMAGVYAHSSRYEGVPKVLVEALASGTPVAATDHLGADVVVRDGASGYLTAHTPDALGGAVVSLLDDPARARAMGQAGRVDVLARFDYERQLDAVVETFRVTAALGRR